MTRRLSARLEGPARGGFLDGSAKVVPIVDRRVRRDDAHAVVEHDGADAGAFGLPVETPRGDPRPGDGTCLDAVGATRRHLARRALERLDGEWRRTRHGDDRAHRRDTIAGGVAVPEARSSTPGADWSRSAA